MPAIDWTSVTSGLVGCTGTPEYRVDVDGLVRWRGTMTTTVSSGAWVISVPIPVAAQPLASVIPLHVDWGAGTRSLYLPATTPLYLAFNGGVASGGTVNLAPLQWQGTAPPVTAGRDLNDVLDGLSAAVGTISGLRTYAYPADAVSPPAAVVGLPEVPYDLTMGGAFEYVVPIFAIVGKVSDRASRTALATYVNATGANSIKAAIEADPTLGGACDSVAVTTAEFTTINVAGTEYLAAELTANVVG